MKEGGILKLKGLINKGRVCIGFMLMLLYITISTVTSYANEEADSDTNRFNVVIVLDASNSMNYTDADGLRYEAIKQFTDLLAESGNHLGGIVFSNHVEDSKPPKEVLGKADKKAVTDMLASVMSDGVTASMGYTNTGEALSDAVNMLTSDGKQDLPSVIIFLSDGNTEMPTDEEQAASLDMKASAIQTAREKHVSIYTVCLNENKQADISEMQQISDATGGVFQEVGSAADLAKVFNTFYNMIYGTSTISLLEDAFPEEGTLQTEFEVPGFGVEEVNVVINGPVSDITLHDPKGNGAEPEKFPSETYTLLKIKDVMAGEWRLDIGGNPGDAIEINMIYNSNLGVEVELTPKEAKFTAEQPLEVKATLKAGNVSAIKDSQYEGYQAAVCLEDAYDHEVGTEAMSVSEGHFETECELEEGVYYLKVVIEGNNLKKESEKIGPLQVVEKGEEAENKPPEAVQKSVKKRVYIWPFKGGSINVDMAELATDDQEDELAYQIVSSSFIEGTDYKVEDNIIKMDHFSLSKGSFDIKATDSEGLSCHVELIIVTRNVGIMALIGIGFIVLIILIVFGVMLRIALTRPFKGTITVKSYVKGAYESADKSPRRGRCRLTAFGVAHIGGGISYSKSYFQATGQKEIVLKTNVPVYCQGRMTNQITIKSGSAGKVKISSNMESKDYMSIEFKSRIGNKANGKAKMPKMKKQLMKRARR